MIAAVALLLAVLFSAPLLVRRGRDLAPVRASSRTRTRSAREAAAASGPDLLAPARVAGVLHLVTIVPYLLLVAWDETVMDPLVRQNADVGALEPAILWYGVVQALGFAALLAGTRSRVATAWGARLPVIAAATRPSRERAAIACAVSIAGAGFVVFIAQVGGFDSLLRQLDRRTALTAGAGYVLALLNFLFFAIAIAITTLRRRRSTLKWALLGVLCLGSAVVFSSLGGRKATILIFVSALFAWHYGVRPVRRIRLVHFAPLAAIVPYFVLMPIVRAPGGLEYFARNPGELAREIGENLETAVTDLSYVDTYVYVANAFRADEIWWGATYLDLLKAPVPSSVDDAKPPLDDGVYLRTRAGGMRSEPGMAFKSLFYSSWPPETLGATYMNFSLPGTIAGMFLLGALYRLAYAYMRRSGYTLFSILVYAHVVISFHWSNLRIVQGLVYLTMTAAFFGLFFGFRAQRRSAARGPGPALRAATPARAAWPRSPGAAAAGAALGRASS